MTEEVLDTMCSELEEKFQRNSSTLDSTLNRANLRAMTTKGSHGLRQKANDPVLLGHAFAPQPARCTEWLVAGDYSELGFS